MKNTAAAKNRSTLKNSKSGFSDPAKIKEQNCQDKPKDGVNTPWSFDCPQYDQRSSNFINAGTHYGVGIKQPIGHAGNPKDKVPVLPYGRVDTMQVDDLG
jgi:hypothetical protein